MTVTTESNGNGQTAAWSASNPQFTLYSHRVGPNGFKVAQVLCELGLHFRTIFLEFGTGENGIKSLAFEAINPNGRIPALVDHSANDLAVWESTAIITYIAKKHDTEFKVWAQSFEDQALIETWLAYQLSGQGPYIGQAMWFSYYHSEQVPSATARYMAETRRVLGVVQKQLERENSNGWLVLGRMTVADLSFVPWYRLLYRLDMNVEEEFPVVWEWMNRMIERPAVKEAYEGSVWPPVGEKTKV